MSGFPTRSLVASDGSDAALAVRAAADLSARAGSEMHVLHTWRRSTSLFPGYSPAGGAEGAERLLEGQAERARAAGGAVAGSHFREGRPAEEIAALAGELGVGLMVIGSRGLGPVKRLVVGSVSEGVVGLAQCPILMMRGGEGAWPQPV